MNCCKRCFVSPDEGDDYCKDRDNECVCHTTLKEQHEWFLNDHKNLRLVEGAPTYASFVSRTEQLIESVRRDTIEKVLKILSDEEQHGKEVFGEKNAWGVAREKVSELI